MNLRTILAASGFFLLATTVLAEEASPPSPESDWLTDIGMQPSDSPAQAPDREPASTESSDAAAGSEAPPAPALPTVAVEPIRPAGPPSDLSEPPRAAVLEEIVVTATKRATSVRDIAGSVTAMSGEQLERQGVQSLDQIVAQIPGVNMSDDGSGNPKLVTIRGIASSPATNFTTGTLFGDIPFSDPFVPKVQLDPNPFDMATVEILKGPQGTLFGGTGLNGMVRYVPQAPEFDAVHVKYYGQFNAYPGNGDSGWSYGAMVNAPFAEDTMALRLMGFTREAPGYVDDTQSGKADINSAQQDGVRGAWAWEPTTDWKISLLGAHQRFEQDDISRSDNFEGRLERGDAPRPSPLKTQYSLANLGIERRFDWGSVMSQSSYFAKEFEVFQDISTIALGGQVPLMAGATYNDSSGFSQELRLVSPDDGSAWRWLAGAFYYALDLYDCTEVAVAELNGVPALPLPGLVNGIVATPCPQNADRLAGQIDVAQLVGDIHLTEKALFGELTRELGESWELTLGARIYETGSSGTVSTAGGLYSLQNGAMPSTRPADSVQNGISPKASIVFEPFPELRSYFTVARGFRFGGPQLGASTPTTQVPDTYKSDSLWSYELGVRSDWFDRTLRVDASVYYIDWKDAQVHQRSNDSLAVFIDNVGGVKGKGVDLSLQYLPAFLEGLSLSASVSWNDTVTTESFQDSSGTEVPAGSPWPNAPRWQSATTLAYTLPLSTVGINASLRHVYLGSACNVIRCNAQVFSYNTLDANLSLQWYDHPQWPELSVSVENLTDERAFNSLSITTVGGVTDVNVINYIAPRALILRISGKF